MKIKTLRVTSLLSTGLVAFLLTACSNSNAPAEQGDKAQLEAVKHYIDSLPMTNFLSDVKDLGSVHILVSLMSPEAKDLLSKPKIISLVMDKLKDGGIASSEAKSPSDLPALLIIVDTVNAETDSRRLGYVFKVEVHLIEQVALQRKGVLHKTGAIVWLRGDFGVISTGTATDRISQSIGNVLNRFVTDVRQSK